jgi:hypothetical protein
LPFKLAHWKLLCQCLIRLSVHSSNRLNVICSHNIGLSAYLLTKNSSLRPLCDWYNSLVSVAEFVEFCSDQVLVNISFYQSIHF